MKRVPLIRKTFLKSYSPLKRAPIKRKRSPEGFSPETKGIVMQRSRGRCEIPDCERPAQHFHHRLLRRFGDHSVANCLHVCLQHHDWIHAHPAESYERGWMIRGN